MLYGLQPMENYKDQINIPQEFAFSQQVCYKNNDQETTDLLYTTFELR